MWQVNDDLYHLTQCIRAVKVNLFYVCFSVRRIARALRGGLVLATLASLCMSHLTKLCQKRCVLMMYGDRFLQCTCVEEWCYIITTFGGDKVLIRV